jgi:hypothetical protein
LTPAGCGVLFPLVFSQSRIFPKFFYSVMPQFSQMICLGEQLFLELCFNIMIAGRLGFEASIQSYPEYIDSNKQIQGTHPLCHSSSSVVS